MKDQYIKNDGFLILYRINSSESLRFAKDEMDYIISRNNVDHSKTIPIVLIGTKCDLCEKDRVISFEDGLEMARKYEIPFFETSAKICINIEEAVFSLINEIHKKREDTNKKKECLFM
jgi:GTPase KRas